MCKGMDFKTADALGLGGLLVDAYKAMQLLASEYDVCNVKEGGDGG